MKGRKWFRRGPDVPERWFPQDELDPESYAFELLFGRDAEQKYPRLIGADAWFDRAEAQKVELHEQSVRVSDGEILTLVVFIDGDMLEER